LTRGLHRHGDIFPYHIADNFRRRFVGGLGSRAKPSRGHVVQNHDVTFALHEKPAFPAALNLGRIFGCLFGKGIGFFIYPRSR